MDVSKSGSKVLEVSMSDSLLNSQSEESWRFEDLKTWREIDHKDLWKDGFFSFDDIKTLAGDDHKDFRKDDSLVFEERSLLKFLEEWSFLGRKDSGSSILGCALRIFS